MALSSGIRRKLEVALGSAEAGEICNALDMFAGSTSALISFFGATPIARTNGYTLTYATASSRTLPAITSLAPPAGGTGTAAGGWDTAGNRDLAITSITAIRTDLDSLYKVVKQIIIDFQDYGLLQ